jgi:hypothetical protein
LEALRTELRKLANMAASIRAESLETGAASFADVPTGRAIPIAGPIADQVEAALEGIDKVMLPVLAISKSGDYLLSRQDRQGIVDILRAPPAPAPANDYDACLLRGLSGTSGDVAAREAAVACEGLTTGQEIVAARRALGAVEPALARARALPEPSELFNELDRLRSRLADIATRFRRAPQAASSLATLNSEIARRSGWRQRAARWRSWRRGSRWPAKAPIRKPVWQSCSV